MIRTAPLAALLLASLAPPASIAGDAPAAAPSADAAPAAVAAHGKQHTTRSNTSNNRALPPATPAPAPQDPQAVLKTKTRSNQSND